MTPGFLSIERKSIRWTRADSDAYLTSLAIGLLAGLLVTYVRTPLHMPGHKVIFWMAPALACRLVTGARAGASVSVLGTIVTTMLLGGQLAGGWMMMPLVLLAGFTLDAAAGVANRFSSRPWTALAFLAMAGTAGNLICFIKRLFDPVGELFSRANIQDLLTAAAYHAMFGFMAGVIGGICSWRLHKYRTRRKHPN